MKVVSLHVQTQQFPHHTHTNSNNHQLLCTQCHDGNVYKSSIQSFYAYSHDFSFVNYIYLMVKMWHWQRVKHSVKIFTFVIFREN